MNISDEAVEAAARSLSEDDGGIIDHTLYEDQARKIIEASAPHLTAEVERELTEAKRTVALLLMKAGGSVTIAERDMVTLDPATVLERTENRMTGAIVITARPYRSAGAGE